MPLRPNRKGRIWRSSVEPDCVQLPLRNLQPLCRKLGIEHYPCQVGRCRRGRAVCEGVVIRREDEPALRQAITDRKRRVERRDRQDRLRRVAYFRQFSPGERKWIKSRLCGRTGKMRLHTPVWGEYGDHDWTRKPSCSEEVALLRSAHHTADWTGWLVYADWLDEHDAPADAALIRDRHVRYVAHEQQEHERAEQAKRGHAEQLSSLRALAPDLPDEWAEFLAGQRFVEQFAEVRELGRVFGDQFEFKDALRAARENATLGQWFTYLELYFWLVRAE